MKTLIAGLVAQRKNHRVIVAVLLTAGAFGGWTMSAMLTPNATAFEGSPRLEMTHENELHRRMSAEPVEGRHTAHEGNSHDIR
jgi:hypothetical protein